MGSLGSDRTGGMTGYNVTTANGQKMTYYFEKSDEGTMYKRSIGALYEPTPNNMTEKEFIQRVQANGGTVEKISNAELARQQEEYRQDRERTNEFLNNTYARNKGADSNNKAYRNTKKAQRINRRR